MGNRQLEGQIFHYEDACYMVLSDNDWAAKTLRVKKVDAKRQICELPLQVVLNGVQERYGKAR